MSVCVTITIFLYALQEGLRVSSIKMITSLPYMIHYLDRLRVRVGIRCGGWFRRYVRFRIMEYLRYRSTNLFKFVDGDHQWKLWYPCPFSAWQLNRFLELINSTFRHTINYPCLAERNGPCSDAIK